MDKIAIYGLYDPTTNKLRYVGKSKQAEKRYSEHVASARYGWGGKCYDWIRDLIADGKLPTMQVLITCDSDRVFEIENRLILRYQSAGYDLVNAVVPKRKKYHPFND